MNTAKTSIKTNLIAVLLATASVPAAADDAMWTWVSGSNSYSQYGTTTTPGGREAGVCWIDSSGDLWLFGGYGLGLSDTGLLNDLWKFNGTSWAKRSGSYSANQAGTYGTKGASDSDNTPGARSNSVSWIDTSDHLWLFGGYGYGTGSSYGMLNDLWKFSGTNWTWVSGSSSAGQYGVYGTMGVPATSNTPGARGWSATWIDSNDDLWLFGGYGYGSSGSVGTLNDLWKFNGSKWTWVSGSKSTSHNGVYGIKGVADANNVPGARYGGISWVDTRGNLWLFGGYGYDSKGTDGYLSDFWKFDGATWAWSSGSDLANRHSSGVYGTRGQSASNTTPSDREAAVSWRDNYGYLWFFGGEGYDSAGKYGPLNDLWKFNGSVWEWVSGSKDANHSGVYGTKGTEDSDNMPGARYYSASCMDTSGNLWLFGGAGYDAYGQDGNLSDLWKFGSIIPAGVQLRVFCEANEITDDHNTPVVIGTAPVRTTGPSQTFTIRNNGSKTLVLDVPFADLTHFTITQPEESVLAPGEDTTFTVTLNTTEIGVFEETVSFDNNDHDNSPFDFPVKGTVVAWEFGNIDGAKKNTKFTASDACGASVTFSLTGGGYGVINGDANFDQVNLYDTGEKSLLTIAASTETSVGDINSNGPLKTIAAKTTNLRGNVTVSGSLASLIINDVNNLANDHTITIGASSNAKAAVSLSFNRVAGLTINSGMPIKTISATEWLGGEISTPSIASVTTKGNKKLGIAGDLDVNVTLDGSAGTVKTVGTLSGEWNCSTIKSISALDVAEATFTIDQAPNVKVPTLGKLTAKRHITDSQIISGGNIGTISARAMINSVCFAGIKDGISGLPDPAADINVSASIKSISVKGLKGESNCFVNSDIAAANILSATLNYPQNNNGGVPFGLSADYIKSLKIKNAGGSTSFKNLNSPSDNQDFDDFKIRLY
jgi:hypothetical protein